MKLKAFVNGKIYTATAKKKWADTIVISGNKIVFTGKAKDCAELIKACNEIIDLQGKLVVPGFIDCHTHFAIGGFSLLNIDYSQVSSKEEFIELTKDYISENDSEWIQGGNWNNDLFIKNEIPHKNWVDSFSENIPLFVTRSDLHMGLANSKTLALAGIDKNTPDPEGGKIMRDENGEPTGILKDNAMKLVYALLNEPSKDDYRKAVDLALECAGKNGVTSVHDIIFNTGSNAFDTYQDHEELTCRVNLVFPLTNYKEFKKLGIKNNLGNEYLKLGSLKAFADGSLGSNTAWFYDSYKDSENDFGLPMEELKTGELKASAMEADLNQNQLVIHAIGDRAVSEVIDIIEEIIEKNPEWDRRPRIEHVQHLKEKDLKRLSENGIIASIQPQHLYDDGVWINNKIEAEHLKDAFRLNSLLENKVNICFGSDWTVAPLEPLMGIYTAVTRKLKNSEAKPFNPEEKISVEEAVKAYTSYAAYSSFEENIKGSIEEGKLADFIVLSDDIFEIEPEQIKNTNVIMTVMDGNIIFDNDFVKNGVVS